MKKRLATSITLVVLLFSLSSNALALPGENVYLETVGGFAGSYIYMTYAYIGVTADAYSKNIYQASQIKVMMDETVNMLANLIKMLQQVRATNIVENDKKFIDSMVEILNLLKTEAEALSAFSVSNDPKDVERYDLARKDAWPRIKKLLGIK